MKHTIIAVLACACSLAANARTIDGVLAEIARNNISLQAMEAEMSAIGYEISSDNTLGAPSVEYSPFFRKGVSGVASSELIVSQEFDFPTLYAARGKSGRMRRDMLASDLAVARRDILFEAKSKCLQLVMLEKQGEILKNRQAVSTELLRLYEVKDAAGDATALDLNRIKLESMQIAAELSSNRAAVARLCQELSALNGDKPISLVNPEYGEVPLMLLDKDYVETLVSNDAAMEAARLSVASAGQDAKVSRQGWLPGLTVGYRRNTEMAEASNGVLIGVSVPLFSTSSKVKAANLRLVASQLTLAEVESNVRNSIAASMAELRDMHELMDVYDTALMSQTLQLLKKSVDMGNMSVTDYYLESDKIYAALQNYIEIENRYHLLAAELLKNEL